MNTKLDSSIPVWQRVVCAVLAICALFPLGFMLSSILDASKPYSQVLPLLLPAAYGAFLFAFAALKGRLPRYLQRQKPSQDQD
jgi:hypothetical protein